MLLTLFFCATGFETIAMVEIDGVTPQDFGYIADNIMDSYAMPLGIDIKNVEIGDVEMVATGLSVVLKLKTCTVPERDELEMKVYDILAQNSEAAAAANTGRKKSRVLLLNLD